MAQRRSNPPAFVIVENGEPARMMQVRICVAVGKVLYYKRAFSGWKTRPLDEVEMVYASRKKQK